ncbi:restriction endonuclease subunit S [Nonomuraea sp. NPDC050478]|uniref:restriction endonuclease subunit S n=1 Tax=Nonomuraea sp. NPDC050478 TaxID=3364365 RepID=UPI0037A41A90
MTDLPSGWVRTTLGELGFYLNGRGFRKTEWSDSGRPIIRIQNLTGSGGDFNHYDGDLEDRYIVRPGDLLISWAATLGAFIWHGPEGALNQHIFKVDSFIDKRFHYYLVQYQLDELYRHTHGSGMVHVTKGRFDSLPVLLPPMKEQQRIVAALEDHLSRLDAGRNYCLNAQRQISSFSAALRTAAVEGRLVQAVPCQEDLKAQFDEVRRLRWHKAFGDRRYKEPVKPDLELQPAIPAEWAVLSLEAATDPVRVIRYGILMPKTKEGGTVPYVEVKDLAGETLAKKVLHKTSRELDEKFAGARLAPGDVVLAVRGSYERSAVVPASLVGANISRDVVRIAPLPGLHPEYLQCYLQSSFVKRYLRRHARGVAVKGVNTAAIRALPVVVPPLDIQEDIVGAVSQQLSVKGKLADEVVRATVRADHLRRSLLAEAFAGRLVAQDSTDEPASSLLERIKMERAAVQVPTRRGPRSRQKVAEPVNESWPRPEAAMRPIIDIPDPSPTPLKGTPVQETLL